MKKLKRMIKKITKIHIIKNVINRSKYIKYYEKLAVDSNLVLAQAYGGMNFYGNMYYMLEEMISRKECQDFKFYIGVRKKHYNETNNFVKEKFGQDVKVLLIGSKEYLKVLATAKYLLNNVGFPTYFIKREEQIYLNTWHGTPLKGLGRGIMDAPHESGNYQRNFLMADYLIYPNEYTFDHMREDYMITNLYEGKYVLCGYPRNSVFFDEDLKKELRKKYDLEKKEILVYMPTWRRKDNTTEEDIQITKCIEILDYLEENLKDNQLLYVKLHNLVNNSVNFNNYEKIKLFPTDCETYEFLSISDALITDYSSVMFDYINCNKKIILYTYDLEEYINGRSVYFDIKNLPFPLCDTKEEVLNQIKNINKNLNYKDVKNKFCAYDNKNATKNLVDLLLKGKASDIKIIEGKKYNNKKSNVLIYTGSLKIDKPSYNLLNSLSELPKNYNFYLNFYKKKVEENKYVINEMPKDIFYITLQGSKLLKLSEAISYVLYYKFNMKNKKIVENVNNLFFREIKRLYPGLKFDYLVDYSYNTSIFNMYSLMDGKKILFFNKSTLSDKTQIKTFILRKNCYNKIYVNNTKIINTFRKKCDKIIEMEYYPDNLKDFKDFLKKMF